MAIAPALKQNRIIAKQTIVIYTKQNQSAYIYDQKFESFFFRKTKQKFKKISFNFQSPFTLGTHILIQFVICRSFTIKTLNAKRLLVVWVHNSLRSHNMSTFSNLIEANLSYSTIVFLCVVFFTAFRFPIESKNYIMEEKIQSINVFVLIKCFRSFVSVGTVIHSTIQINKNKIKLTGIGNICFDLISSIASVTHWLENVE